MTAKAKVLGAAEPIPRAVRVSPSPAKPVTLTACDGCFEVLVTLNPVREGAGARRRGVVRATATSWAPRSTWRGSTILEAEVAPIRQRIAALAVSPDPAAYPVMQAGETLKGRWTATVDVDGVIVLDRRVTSWLSLRVETVVTSQGAPVWQWVVNRGARPALGAAGRETSRRGQVAGLAAACSEVWRVAHELARDAAGAQAMFRAGTATDESIQALSRGARISSAPKSSAPPAPPATTRPPKRAAAAPAKGRQVSLLG